APFLPELLVKAIKHQLPLLAILNILFMPIQPTPQL
ncbi:unnamed protein product, partial [marine sediment metagenome]